MFLLNIVYDDLVRKFMEWYSDSKVDLIELLVGSGCVMVMVIVIVSKC